jgi:hypothetical protein
MACPNMRGGCRTDLGALVWCRALASFAMRTRAPIAITANFAFMMTSSWHAVRMPAPAHSCTMTIRRHGILGLPPAAMKGCSPRPKPWPPATVTGFWGAPVAAGHEARRQKMTRSGLAARKHDAAQQPRWRMYSLVRRPSSTLLRNTSPEAGTRRAYRGRGSMGTRVLQGSEVPPDAWSAQLFDLLQLA